MPKKSTHISACEAAYLCRGMRQPDGSLPLFDETGQRISPATIKSCLEKGLIEHWFANPLRPDWLKCRLTAKGRAAL